MFFSIFKILKPTNINEETNHFADLSNVFLFQKSSYTVVLSLHVSPASIDTKEKYQRFTYNIRKLEILA